MGLRDYQTISLFSLPEGQHKQQISTPQELRKAAMRGKPSDRSEFARSVSIDVDNYRLASRFMNALLDRAKRSKCAGGLWILGNGGQGKSFILESFIRRHPPSETTEGRNCSVLLLPFRGRPAVSEILLTILLQLGQNPDTLKSQSNTDLQGIVERAIAHCGVKMILFDEAQHLWLLANANPKRIKDRLGGHLGDLLKTLYDNTGVAYVFAGTPGLDVILEEETQANTRWTGVLRLEPFEYDQKFRGILETLDEALPMEERAGLSGEELSAKIYEASGGNFRKLKNFIADAVYLAADEGAKSIQNQHFASAYFRMYCTENTPFGQAV